jgi:hypothetical protein
VIKLPPINYSGLTVFPSAIILFLYIFNNFFGLQLEIALLVFFVFIYELKIKINPITTMLVVWIVLLVLPIRVLYPWGISILLYLSPILVLLFLSILSRFKARVFTYPFLVILVFLSLGELKEIAYEAGHCVRTDTVWVDVFLCKNSDTEYFQIFSTVFGSREFCLHCQGKLALLRTTRFIITIPLVIVITFLYIYIRRKYLTHIRPM